VQLKYSVWHKANASLQLYAGGAFAFGRAQCFYAVPPNFTTIGVVFSTNVHLGRHELPVAATARWNSENGYGTVQAALTLC
jgi:hypothetical protein